MMKESKGANEMNMNEIRKQAMAKSVETSIGHVPGYGSEEVRINGITVKCSIIPRMGRVRSGWTIGEKWYVNGKATARAKVAEMLV